MQKALTALLCASLLSATSLLQAEATPSSAADYVVFKTLPDEDPNSDCAERGGMRVFVFNEHPNEIIDLSIDRYFDNVRQPGRSMFALGFGHSQPLGCNLVMDAKQHWELIDANFISPEKADERYGSVQ